MRQYAAGERIRRVTIRRPVAALTFDDGPNEPYTSAALDTLRETNTPATFFLVGSAAEHNPDIVRRIVREGHSLGAHSYDHARLTSLSLAQVTAEIRHARRSLEHIAGTPVPLFRPPYGAWNKRLDRVAEAEGVRVVMWSSQGRDWESNQPEAIVERILSSVEPGAIVLLHDGDEGRAGADRSVLNAALPTLITALRSRGYRLVTLDKLLALGATHRRRQRRESKPDSVP